VIALTTTMMVAEIVAGTLFGSMALVADGWHTATHAAAVLIGACISLRPQERAQPALYLRRRQDGGLAGFAGAIVLALIAVLIGWEAFCVSARRSLR
jgi:Co/Zn/Cd efflux system component